MVPWKRILLVPFRLVLIAIVLLIPFNSALYGYAKSRMHFNDWSETRNIVKNGRIGSFFYYHGKRAETVQKIKHKNGAASYSNFYKKVLHSKRNIHIIVLESFVDPRYIEGLKFSKSPVHKSLASFLNKGDVFSVINNPVYGGGSPQSEFEILTGVPAYAQVASTEFNAFEGTKTSSFIRRLREAGYYSMVAKGSKPGYYNSTNAYKGLGFDEIHYRGKSYYNKKEDDDYIFDGDLFAANLKYLKENLYTLGKHRPFVNYVVGMYGHLPFKRNEKARPAMIKTNINDPLIFNLANQFYYRTKALGIFLHELQSIDPEALVFIVSDHLPPIFQKGRKYTLGDLHQNIALLLDGFKPVKIDGINLHQISHILWEMLSGETGKTRIVTYPDQLLAAVYLTVMQEAIGSN